MFYFISIVTLALTVFGAPQGYEYKEQAPVKERNSFQPPIAAPCTHNIQDASVALIQSQSQGRIVNHKTNYGLNHNLVAAASGYIKESQLAPLNTISVDQGATKSQLLPTIIAPPKHFLNGGNAQQVLSIQNNGYSFASNQATSSTQFSPKGNNFIKPSLSSQPLLNTNIPLSAGLIGNLIAPRPVHALNNGYATGYQHNSVAYEHSFGHSNNFPAPTFTHHNVQDMPNELPFGNSEISNGGTESLANTASLSNVKHTSNGNIEFNVGALNGQLGHVIRETFANAPLDPTIEKHIYVHVPPEDIEEDNNDKSVVQYQASTPPKKHYKIIFIKAPTYPTPNYNQLAAAISPPAEEKTLVYVLVKKPEVPSIDQIQQIQQSSYKSSKPEVYFIKYKTHKESDNSQYSLNLQNPTEILNEPVKSIPTESDNALIDIRSGGKSSSISTSTSNTYSLLSNGVSTNEPKHELYGVPLQ